MASCGDVLFQEPQEWVELGLGSGLPIIKINDAWVAAKQRSYQSIVATLIAESTMANFDGSLLYSCQYKGSWFTCCLLA